MDELENTRKQLEEEYQSTLEMVSLAITGTEESEWQLKKLEKLHEQIMDERKLEADNYRYAQEMCAKEEERKATKIHNFVDGVLKVFEIVLPLGVTSYWMAKGLEFEETGCYTSKTGTWLNNHLRIFKKK